jgi:hypothetical protein
MLAVATAVLYYAPSWFLKELVEYLEDHPDRSDIRWGWVWSFALFASNAIMYIAVGVMWSISSTHLQSSIKLQIITLLFSKTLVKKDLASGPTGAVKTDDQDLRPATHGVDASGVENEGQDREGAVEAKKAENKESEEEDVSSKAQVMTLFQIDCERIAEFSFHSFSLLGKVTSLERIWTITDSYIDSSTDGRLSFRNSSRRLVLVPTGRHQRSLRSTRLFDHRAVESFRLQSGCHHSG